MAATCNRCTRNLYVMMMMMMMLLSCAGVSAESGGAVSHTEQEADVDVGSNKDRCPVELQVGR